MTAFFYRSPSAHASSAFFTFGGLELRLSMKFTHEGVGFGVVVTLSVEV
jgi:hypothetical protein